MYYILSVLLYLALHITPILAADVPEETLHVSPPPEFQIDLVSAIRPVIEDNYIVIQGFIAIYLFFEFFIFPWLDELEQAKEKDIYLKKFSERDEWRDEYYKKKRERLKYERDREREIENRLFNDEEYSPDYDF